MVEYNTILNTIERKKPKTLFKLLTHKRHTKPQLYGWCMGCLFWILLMMTSSNRSTTCITGPLCREYTSPHKGQWHGVLMFSLICTPTNGWVNNRDTSDLRCHCTQYDVTVIEKIYHEILRLHCTVEILNKYTISLTSHNKNLNTIIPICNSYCNIFYNII